MPGLCFPTCVRPECQNIRSVEGEATWPDVQPAVSRPRAGSKHGAAHPARAAVAARPEHPFLTCHQLAEGGPSGKPHTCSRDATAAVFFKEQSSESNASSTEHPRGQLSLSYRTPELAKRLSHLDKQ